MKRSLFILTVMLLIKALSCTGLDHLELLEIHSDEAEYNGEEILLTGHVDIQHEIGHIRAHQLVVTPSTEQTKKQKFSFLTLKKEVVVESIDSGQLFCQEATIDYGRLKGTFLGNVEHPDVIYLNQTDKKGQVNPLSVKSEKMQVNLHRYYNPSSQSYQSSIQQIEAEKKVRVLYNQDYTILADRALYQRDQESLPGEKITLYTDEKGKKCQVTNQQGDEIQAEIITVDLTKRQISFEQVQGVFSPTQQSDLAKPALYFSCRYLIWDEEKQKLVLQDDVQLSQGGLGYLKTDSTIEIYRSPEKKEIQSIVSQSKTQVIYGDDKTDNQHMIFSYGPLIIDQENSRMFMYSPVDEQNHVLPGQQVYFEDGMGELYANYLQLDYQWINRAISPSKLMMQGNVQVLNRFDGHLQESSSVLQYALADLMEYFPSQKEMILSSQSQQRVLLLDKMNNLQMSAPSLRIRHQGVGNKVSIQGVGDVRFTFIKTESDQINKHFHINPQVSE